MKIEWREMMGLINGDTIYHFYTDGQDIGEMHRGDDGNWQAKLIYNNIKAHGRYRFDVMGDIEMKWRQYNNG